MSTTPNRRLHEDGGNGSGSGSDSQLNWKDMKEQHRVKQYDDAPVGNSETFYTSRTSLHGPVDAAKEGLHVDNRDFAKAREAVGENKVDIKEDDKWKDIDIKWKEVKRWDWGERDKERSDRHNNLQPGNSSNENKEVVREEKESERWRTEKKESFKEKEKQTEKDHVERVLWDGSDKEASNIEKELVDIPGKYVEHESPTLEPQKKDHDTGKQRKKERDADVEPKRPDKRSRHHEKESAEGGIEREREVFNSGVKQRKRMRRPRGSNNEGSQGKADVSCVVYKIGECMQELVKLWKEYELLQTDKASEGSHSGPTLEIRIPAEHVTAINRQIRGGQLWGTDIYTVDSDLVAVLMHTGYCSPSASPPPSATEELRATVRVLPPQKGYISTLRNNIRSRAWEAAVDCSYRVEHCCFVQKGGGSEELEPCLTHSSSMDPTFTPVAEERTMTTRAAASNALRQQRLLGEVGIKFNLCFEPWLKYSMSDVADKDVTASLYTSTRLKKGEVLYVETHSRRYELCYNGKKASKTATAPHTSGMETGRTETYNPHLANGERNLVDGKSTVVDIFRWSWCKRPLLQKVMQTVGIPLPIEHLEVLEENVEWEDISWSENSAWIGGREYHLIRAQFLSPY